MFNVVKSSFVLTVLVGVVIGGASYTWGQSKAKLPDVTLLNVSYDPTREFYKEYNSYFESEWKKSTGQAATFRQSHAGSGKQARAVIDGLEADVVTLALAYDIDVIAKAGKLPANWQSRLPHNSAPYTSTIVFLVRKGNPKKVQDWSDLVKPGISVITPNPKTSGGARWNFLGAWLYAVQTLKTEAKAKQFVAALYKNVPVLDTGARGSTMTFVERGLGDVLLAWENEALLITKTIAPGQFEVVYPSLSVLAEPTVAVVDTVAKKRGTEKVAQAYLKGLYDSQAQTLAAKYFYRPRDKKVAAKFETQFPKIKLIDVQSVFKNWDEIQTKFFNDGGIFDGIYEGK